MSDPIQSAINKAVQKSQQSSTFSSLNQNASRAQEAISGIQDDVLQAQQKATELKNRADDLKNQAQNIKDKFPTDKDVELLKRRAEALVLEKIAELDRIKLEASEYTVEDIRDLIAKLQSLLGPLTLKLPVLDPKILQTVALAKKIKEVYKLRQKLSKENLKQGIEKYSYPIKKIIPEIPEKPPLSLNIPELPQLPEIPELPFRRG